MKLTEQKRKKFDIFASINDELDKKYSVISNGEYSCNVNKNGVFFRPFIFDYSERAFGIEYASDEKEAALGEFEDGDLFYLDDYSTLNKMIEDMCVEIDSIEE